MYLRGCLSNRNFSKKCRPQTQGPKRSIKICTPCKRPVRVEHGRLLSIGELSSDFPKQAFMLSALQSLIHPPCLQAPSSMYSLVHSFLHPPFRISILNPPLNVYPESPSTSLSLDPPKNSIAKIPSKSLSHGVL